MQYSNEIPIQKNTVILGDSEHVLKRLPKNFFRLIYIDPPYNTGKTRKKENLVLVDSIEVSKFKDNEEYYRKLYDRENYLIKEGYSNKIYIYRKEDINLQYEDDFDDYLSFLSSKLVVAKDLLTEDGSIFVHLDYREVHYVKVFMDKLFGRENFMNEIIWAYDYGGKPKRRWPAKHSNILWYVKDRDNYVFNYDDIDRIPYMAPSLVSEEKAALGKVPTDVWWISIVVNSKEKVNYPTQKPLKLLERIIRVHTNINDWVLDFFAGSGTTGVAAAMNFRRFVLVDKNEDAISIIKSRVKSRELVFLECR